MKINHLIKLINSSTACSISASKIVSEYDQEIPQSQTADKPVASWGRATQQSRDIRQNHIFNTNHCTILQIMQTVPNVCMNMWRKTLLMHLLVLPSVWFNKLEMSHCKYRGATWYRFQIDRVFLPLKIDSVLGYSVDPDEMCHFIWVVRVASITTHLGLHLNTSIRRVFKSLHAG